MDKVLKMGQTSATGSSQLFIGKVLSTALMTVGGIILTLLISEDDYGLFAVALIPSLTLLLFYDWGVGAAITRYCANYRAAGQTDKLFKVIISGLIFEAATGLALTVASLLMANFFASAIFGKPESAFLITIASISILASAVSGIAQSALVGFERMGLISLIVIFQAVAQTIVAPLLVYLGYGAIGAVLGYTIASVVAGISSLALLYFKVLRKLCPFKSDMTTLFQTIKPLLSFGVPLAVSAIVFGIFTQFISFMMASFVDSGMIGNYRVATNFAVFSTFISVPIGTVLFPAFSKLDVQKELPLFKKVFASSVKYAALLLVPATLGMIVLSNPLIGTLYGDKWPYAQPFLSLYVTNDLFVLLGGGSLVSLLSALGATKLLLKLNVLNILIAIPLAFLLIPSFGIFGVIVVTITAAAPSTFFGLHWLWKRYGIKANISASTKILAASILSAAVTFLFLNAFVAADWIKLSTGLIIFLFIYLISASLFGAIDKKDLSNLRNMFCRAGVFSKLLEIPLQFVELILGIRDRYLEVKVKTN
jgi:O-antigen/teichoic acid export membrane protein